MHVCPKANTNHDSYQRPTDIRDQQLNIQANQTWKNEHNFNKLQESHKKTFKKQSVYIYIYEKY